MSYVTIQIQRQGSLVRVMLDRPEARNAMNQQMIGELLDFFEHLSDDRAVRVIVLSGSGKSFCAGGDIREMRAVGDAGRETQLAQAARLDAMLTAVDEAPQVVISQVHGAALGGGVGLLCVSDIAVAADDAVIGMPEVRLGIVPAIISPFVVARLGLARARQQMLTGSRVSGQAAIDAGYVSAVYPRQALAAAVDGLVNDVLQAAPSALAAVKSLLRMVEAHPPAESRSYRVDLLSRLQASNEGREGLAAFLEKRRPAWVETI